MMNRTACFSRVAGISSAGGAQDRELCLPDLRWMITLISLRFPVCKIFSGT